MKKINASSYRDMMRYGINYLDKHCAIVNDLNVFPVPDGDTGTNMVMTMKNGLSSMDGESQELRTVAQSFANATVFGARGNSGVIVSQFFKGLSEGLSSGTEADCRSFSGALRKGCEYAYAAVATPTEGTILTVLREATEAVARDAADFHNIDELIASFLQEAKRSLKNTPNLLPILAKAGVVDSGGSGIVYFFEGIQRYLNGEELETLERSAEVEHIDYSAFNRNTLFEFGYCTELLLQLTCRTGEFDYGSFTTRLAELGESLVTSLEGDKVKIHIHTHTPERVLQFAHGFGEFLSLKIENMTVQHSGTSQKLLCTKEPSSPYFSVVAVAPNTVLQQMLSEMGADVVIMSEEVPSSKDFIEAFEKAESEEILVFPNSSNSILSAMQAGSLYKGAKITVLNCRSIAECYSAMAIMDFENPDIRVTVEAVNDTIGNMLEVSVIHATKNIKYGDRSIVKNDYFALAGDEILFTADRFERAVMLTVEDVIAKRDCSVVNLFYGRNVSEESIEMLAAEIERSFDVESCTVSTQNPIYDLLLSFE